MLIPVYSLSLHNLQEQIVAAGFKAFRYRQLIKWLYQKAVNDPDKMTDLPQDFKSFLISQYDLSLPEVINKYTAADGAKKYVLRLADGNLIESVLMPEGVKNTLCLSSQVGCAFGCLFCATGKLGAIRDLTVSEIVGQVIIALQELGEQRLTNLVFMGMGEPLDNLTHVLPAITILQSDYTLQFSPRRMTLSTCGFVPKIKELADLGIKIKLAVSINSALDSKRNELMPVNRTYDLASLKQAIVYYRSKSPWRVTLEYIMIPDYNMGNEDAKALMKFAGDLSCKLNLIAWNKVSGLPWRSPTAAEALAFQEQLRKLPIAVTIRRSRGEEIAAACGQLAAQTTVA